MKNKKRWVQSWSEVWTHWTGRRQELLQGKYELEGCGSDKNQWKEEDEEWRKKSEVKNRNK